MSAVEPKIDEQGAIALEISDLDSVTKQVVGTVPKDRVAREYASIVGQYARAVKVKGFRPGKVPPAIVEKMWKGQVEYEVVQRLTQEVVGQAIEQNNLRIVGEPVVDLDVFNKDEPLVLKVKLSLVPQPVISNYADRTVEVEKKSVAEADVESAIDRLRQSKAQLTKIEDRKVAEKGDVVALSVAIAKEGETAGRPEPFVDELGAGRLSAEVEEQVVGMNVGDAKEVTVTTPDDHPRAELRNERVTYALTLVALFSKSLPELNDDFAQGVGIEASNMEELREKLRVRIASEVEREAKLDAQGALLDLLVSEHKFEVPQPMVDEEIRWLVVRYGFGGGKISDPRRVNVEAFRPELQDFALNRLRCALIVDAVAEQEKIEPTEEDRNRFLEQAAERQGMSVDDMRRSALSKERITEFLAEVKRSKVLDFLVSKTTVTYKEPAAA